MKLIHGGDVAGYEAEYGAKPLDFSANINPLGLPQGVRQAVIGALDSADAYPDPLCRKLRQAIARQEGLPMEQILCGNGAADLIFRLVLALRPKKALVTAPTFAEYEQALALVGCQVQRHMLLEKDDFQLMDRFLQQLHPGLDLVFLCNPNNPTGQVIRPALLDEIGERCGKMGIRLVVDECFQSFLDQPDRHTMKGKLEKNPMLFLLRAFTKFYAMAGIRLGYGLCADTQLLEQMETVFVRQFSTLQEYFSETFTRLFGGGRGEISMSDPSDPLGCGIDIIVQPPGKKRQLLSLFSGGERALTAIALLFAMLKLKPTPFCILDEIEAALDDANISYFADYLKEFSKDTQFIVVTHRKGTMERCDTLFGVAMEERGVSSMVSVNLTDYE